MSFRPIFYDTETTGVRPDRDQIIEIAAYDPQREKSFERLIKPSIPIPPEATAVHKISEEMVALSDNFSQVGKEFIDFCEGEVILVAHNNDSFDMPILKNEASRHNLTLPSWRFLDSLKWARRYRPDLPKHTLQFLRETYGIAQNNAHRALDDVIVLYQLFTLMSDDLSILEAQELLDTPRDLQHMPFGKHQGTALKNLPKDYVRWLAGSGALDKAENQQLRLSLEKIGSIPHK